MTFELAKKEDSNPILTLYKELKDTPGWNDIPNVTKDYPSMEEVRRDIENNTLYKIQNNKNKIIAVIGLEKNNQYDNLSCWDSSVKNWVDLVRLGVSKKEQQKGIGKMIVNFALAEAQKLGFDGIRLITAQNNYIARNLYEKMGFTYKDTRKEFGIDCSTYEKIFVKRS